MGDIIEKIELLSETRKKDLLKYLDKLLKEQGELKSNSFDQKIKSDALSGKLDSLAQKAVQEFSNKQNLDLQTTDSVVRLNEAQKKLIKAGLKDLENVNTITQERMDKEDIQWLEEM